MKRWAQLLPWLLPQYRKPPEERQSLHCCLRLPWLQQVQVRVQQQVQVLSRHQRQRKKRRKLLEQQLRGMGLLQKVPPLEQVLALVLEQERRQVQALVQVQVQPAQ